MGSERASYHLESFWLYETFSNYYLVGSDEKKTRWRVLKIDRMECSELNIMEDSTIYSENECSELLTRLEEGNKKRGGLKLITTCYGIVGFVKFLEPYYMLLITKRREIGEICGHKIYGIEDSKMIPIPNPTVRTLMAYSKNENRYKKLLCVVNLTKDFFFSYSYNVMRTLQKNFGDYKTGQYLYKKMFVWNEFLTSEIRNRLGNTLWTVALVHGFCKQKKLSISGKDFKLTLIARRSRFFAGTRYLKRGVNERGRVANDVETEQIVSEDDAEGCAMQISSVVQYRGSVPLFWSQNISGFQKFRPEFCLPAEQDEYKATVLHFKNLVKRYGKPIIILSLLKVRGKKRAEKTLGAEYAKAITYIIENVPEMDHLRYCRWDLHRHMYDRRAIHELQQLGELATDTLDWTGIFYCQVTPNLRAEGFSNFSCFNGHCSLEDPVKKNDDANSLEKKPSTNASNRNASGAKCRTQKGVLRTNCMDCLDRTNVAQYAFGVAALGRQLHALRFIDYPTIDFDSPLAENLMKVYKDMGDTLALQYVGSPAHDKIFANVRGEWGLATDYRELITAVQRFYSNAFVDFDRQDAINLFLGYFRPQQGKPFLWELDVDQRYGIGRSSFKRSLSDTDILSRSNSTMVRTDVMLNQHSSKAMSRSMSLFEFMPESLNQASSNRLPRRSMSLLEFRSQIQNKTSFGMQRNSMSILESTPEIPAQPLSDAQRESTISEFDGELSSAGNSSSEVD